MEWERNSWSLAAFVSQRIRKSWILRSYELFWTGIFWVKVAELCGSECLLKTTMDFRKLLSCFVGSCFRQARIIVMVKVKVFAACREQQDVFGL